MLKTVCFIGHRTVVNAKQVKTWLKKLAFDTRCPALFDRNFFVINSDQHKALISHEAGFADVKIFSSLPILPKVGFLYYSTVFY